MKTAHMQVTARNRTIRVGGVGNTCRRSSPRHCESIVGDNRWCAALVTSSLHIVVKFTSRVAEAAQSASCAAVEHIVVVLVLFPASG